MKLTIKQKVSFGIGAIGKDMVYSLVSGFILYYYNTILGISGTFTGIMMMAARVFDAFNDPLMGVVVEKTNTRFGKFRPWIFTGTVTNALILYGMFAMPRSLQGTPMLVYATVAYVLWGVTYTLMDIPFWSMIPAITRHCRGFRDHGADLRDGGKRTSSGTENGAYFERNVLITDPQ